MLLTLPSAALIGIITCGRAFPGDTRPSADQRIAAIGSPYPIPLAPPLPRLRCVFDRNGGRLERGGCNIRRRLRLLRRRGRRAGWVQNGSGGSDRRRSLHELLNQLAHAGIASAGRSSAEHNRHEMSTVSANRGNQVVAG